MKKNDVSYYDEESKIKFNFRVAMIACNGNKILLQKSDKDNYYSLIGGRVRLSENTKDAIIREIEEETGVRVTINEIKLIKVIENFFVYNGKNFHELLFIYKIKNDILNSMDNFYTLDKDNVINKWYNITEIKNMDIQPVIVKDCYNDINITHDIID